MDLSFFPPFNATLNACAAVMLATGYRAIKRKQIEKHKKCMLSAVIVSGFFLISYVTYHTLKHRFTGQAHTTFNHTGFIRTVYLSILWSHLTLAIVIVPLIIITLSRALRNQFDKHVRIARWTFPLWMYVSVTGVIVYLMLYHLPI
jgi:protein SCO1/2/putative membrane protein